MKNIDSLAKLQDRSRTGSSLALAAALVTAGAALLAGACGKSGSAGPADGGGTGGNGGAAAAAGGRTGTGGRTGGATGAGGRIGGTGGGAGGAGGAVAGDLAKACSSNAECTGGLVCATATGDMLAGTGPAHGYCTISCDDSSDVCGPMGAICVDFGTPAAPAAYCMQTCTFGEVATRTSKCRGRQDVACASLTSGAGTTVYACMPMCFSASPL